MYASCDNIVFVLTTVSVNHSFSDNDRRRCRSVAQMSALLRGNEWTSLRTFAHFAVTLRVRLELI